MKKYILSIDQGTTSTRSILFSTEGTICHSAQEEFPQHFPQDGWVEHEPEDLWQSVLSTCAKVFAEAAIQPEQIGTIGITNQRAA